jgi:hypothetical protein
MLQILFARPSGKVLGSEKGRKIKSGLLYDYATEKKRLKSIFIAFRVEFLQ